MATAGDIKYNVTCGVLEQGNDITLMYTIPDSLKSISWEWIPQPSEDGTNSYIAQMIAKDSKRGHRSKPIPEDVYKKLGSKVHKSRVNIYFRVKFSGKDNVSIEKYFNQS